MTGVSPFIQVLWLGALAAGEKMARRMRDDGFAERLHATFAKAAPQLDAMLWNGEYYQQVYNAAGDTRYQHGPGCLSDQLLGQWFAHLLDLGYLWPADKVRRAIRSVFHYNFRDSFAGFVQAPRRFAFDNEQGLVICTWPKGGRPAVPLLYSDEVWTGIEYQVAAHLLWEGFVPEGLAVAKAARDRYRGQNRNPWNEIECGDNHARAMSSWSLLLAAQGFSYDGPAGRIGFLPRLTPNDHRSLFTAAEGWGRFATRVVDGRRDSTITVDWGSLTVREVTLPAGQTAAVKHGEQAVRTVAASEGERLVIRLVLTIEHNSKSGADSRALN